MRIEDLADIVFGTTIPNDSYVIRCKRRPIVRLKVDPNKDPRYQDASEVIDELFSDNRRVEKHYH